MHGWWWMAGAGLVALMACGDDSDAGGESCPAGTAAGAQVDCTCGDGGPMGVQVCGEDSTLSDCDCSGDTGSDTSTGGDGDTGDTGTGDTDTGGTDTGDTGTDDTTPPAATVDAGMGTDVVDEPMTPAVQAPTDGNQLALCEDDRDCNAGLGCYTNGGGMDFCSATCDEDADCESLTGASWECSSTTNVCQVVCEGPDDDGSCPDGMACIEFGGGGGGGGGGATFRCKWPEPEPELSGPFGPCEGDDDCEGDLECFGGGFMGTGYCSNDCQNDGDCNAQPATGDLTASCETLQAGGPMPSGVCALDCDSNADGCPDGMECATGPGFARCAY